MQLEENRVFANRYKLERLLGRGGFSEVWLVEDTLTSLKVALKVYAPGGGMDEHGVQLFSSEFSLVFNLNHSHLLKPTYYDTFERMPYLVLPFCEKGSAANLIGRITEKEAWLFLRDLASGLEFLHGQEPPVIHQDIKPDNVLIDTSGHYLLTDFGISIKARNTLRKSIMKTEGSVGTLAYMGPERFSKYPLPIKASDVFSLGATLYELLTGMVPFGEHGGLLLQHGAEIPELEGSWSEPLKGIINLCLRKETWERPSATEIRAYCEQYLHGENPVLPGKHSDIPEEEPPVEKEPETDSATEPEPGQEADLTKKTAGEPEILPDSTSDEINSHYPPKYIVKLLKWSVSLLAVAGIILFISHSIKQNRLAEEAEAKRMEIESRYAEYLQYVHDGDSLMNLGNQSQGEGYEQYYLGASGRYDAALSLENEYRSDFSQLKDVASKKKDVLRKIDDVYNLFVSMAQEAELNQDYSMAEIFYQRASGMKPEQSVLKEYHARRETASAPADEQTKN